MAEQVEVAIESALLEHLAALSFSPSTIRIAYPNRDFKPDPISETCYLRPTLLPAPTAALSVGHEGSNEHLGILQVDVFYKQFVGSGPPGRIAAQVIQHFARGTTLSADGYEVRIDRPPYRSALRQDDPWVQIPVTITWHAYATNPA